MSIYLDEHLSEILSTIIAVGFIEEQREHANFVYESPTDESDHRTLERILHERCGIKIKFNLAASQDIEPFIAGQTRTVFGNETIQQIADDFMTDTNIIQTKFSEQIQDHTPGAYIGSLIDLNKIEFDSPSELYLYTPRYRNPDNLTLVKKAYDKARSVTDILIQFLDKNLPAASPSKRKLQKSDRISRHNPEPAYAEKHLFASCHGMILAIYDYGYYLGKEGVCAELALGKDTRKVASCLPCSLFMSANGFPASATHLGRGDNWNYPLRQENHLMTKNWKKAVYHAYQTGIMKLPALGMDFTGILEQGLLIEGNPEKEIPLLFLEALTFEGSFIKKMIQVLSHFEQNIN